MQTNTNNFVSEVRDSNTERRITGDGKLAKGPGTQFVRLFAVQLLPLIVFIAVDSFVADIRVSIACAVLFALGQLLVIFFRHRRFEWLVVVDVGLIGILGGVSIVFKDDAFFKIKPAMMEGLAFVLLAGLRFSPEQFLIRYFGRLAPGITFRPESLKIMKNMLTLMAVSTAIHIGGVLYSAFYMSREIWAAVSGPGFYIFVLSAPVTYLFIIRRRQSRRRTQRNR